MGLVPFSSALAQAYRVTVADNKTLYQRVGTKPGVATSRTQQGYLVYTTIAIFGQQIMIQRNINNHDCSLRLFIAIELTQPIREKIGQIMIQLKSGSPKAISWSPINNIHLTLIFLGETPEINIIPINNILNCIDKQHHSFQLEVEGLGVFPRPERPRIIWIGINKSPELQELQIGIEKSMGSLGAKIENRPFHAHLTLGRVSHQALPTQVAAIRNFLTTINVGRIGVMDVNSIHLMRSDLKLGGTLYTRLFTGKLGSPLV
jgi:2'-5' RNA ligase